MKITRLRLRQIINEEISRVNLAEALKDIYDDAGMDMPSTAERKEIATFLRMPDAENYTGTAAQNAELEELITAGGGPEAIATGMEGGSDPISPNDQIFKDIASAVSDFESSIEGGDSTGSEEQMESLKDGVREAWKAADMIVKAVMPQGGDPLELDDNVRTGIETAINGLDDLGKALNLNLPDIV